MDPEPLERDPRVHLAVRHPGLGRRHRAAPVFLAVIVVAVLRPDRPSLGDRRAEAAAARRGQSPVPPAGVHMPGPSFAPFFAAVGTFLLFFGPRLRRPADHPRAHRPRPDPPLLGPRGRSTEYDHVAGDAPQLPAVDPRGAAARRPHARPVVPAAPRLDRVASSSLGLVFGGWLLGVGVAGHDPDAARLAERRPQGIPPRRRGRHDRPHRNEPAPRWPKAVLSVDRGARRRDRRRAQRRPGSRRPARPAAGPAPSGGSAGPSPRAVGAGRAAARRRRRDRRRGREVRQDSRRGSGRQAFKITFDNQDAGTPHDVDILDAAGARRSSTAGLPRRRGRRYDVPALEAGTYKFVCSIHPALMTAS